MYDLEQVHTGPLKKGADNAAVKYITKERSVARPTTGPPPPPEVLAVMRAAMKAQPGVQIADISNGLEDFPIPVVNTVDEEAYDESLVKYTRRPVVPEEIQKRMARSPPLVCKCTGPCGGLDCEPVDAFVGDQARATGGCACVDAFNLA